ncbi:MAG: VanZ family protein [Anaerolineaceae bacterium]
MRIVPPLLVVAWAGVIFFFSSLSNPPGTTGDEWQSNLAHFAEYAVLAALLFWALRTTLPTSSMVALAATSWLVSVAYGISDEYHQSFVVNRDSNPMDVGFDAVGSAVAIIVLFTIVIGWSRKKS